MNDFKFPNSFPNGISFAGSYENVQNYKTILINYHSTSIDTLTISYSDNSISTIYTTTYQISNQQLIIYPVYLFFKIDVTGGFASRYCKCTYLTELINGILDNSNIGLTTSSQNNLSIEVFGSNSEFGDILVTKEMQAADNTFIYGLKSMISNGLISVNNNLLTCTTAFNLLSTSSVYSQQIANLTGVKFTASFIPDNNTVLMAGVGMLDSGIYFGYDPRIYYNAFSIIIISGAIRQVVSLPIPFPSASTNSLILVIGVNSYTVPMTIDANNRITANNIANFNYNSDYNTGWTTSVSIINNVPTIIFVSSMPGFRTGYLVTGFNPLANSLAFVNLIDGSIGTTANIPQSSWNIDKMDGRGPNKMILNTSKGNVYWMKFQNSGFGKAIFGIEEANTGKLIPVHINDAPNINMSFSIYAIHITHLSSTGSINCASYSLINNPGIPAIIKNYRRIINNSLLLFSLRNKIIYNNSLNQSMATPISINICNASDANIIIYIYVNCILNLPAFNGTIIDNSMIEVDTTSKSFTSGTQILSICVAKNQNQIVNLKKYNFVWSPGTIITISETTNATTKKINIAIQWEEYQ